MKTPLTAFLFRGLPGSSLALAAGIAGLAHANPALALGGGVTISQSGGVTTVAVAGAVTTSKPGTGSLSGVTDGPYDLVFTLANAPVATSWASTPSGPEFRFFNAADPVYNNSLYTDLTGTPNILTGTYLPQGDSSSLVVTSTGEIKLSIISTVDEPPDGCYTGKLITSATGANCNQYLNILELTVQTSKTGIVPPTNPGTLPSIGSLLSNYTGIYNGTGSLSSGGAEQRLLFKSEQHPPVPSPLPVFGASMAFGFSRRLRQRITQSKVSSAASQRSH